jgi:hypothetical protein
MSSKRHLRIRNAAQVRVPVACGLRNPRVRGAFVRRSQESGTHSIAGE